MCNDAMAVRIDESGSVLVRSEKANIELWMDVWEEDGEMCCDWNKYIFFLTDERDLRDRAFQQDSDNFEAFSNAAIEYFESCNVDDFGSNLSDEEREMASNFFKTL